MPDFNENPHEYINTIPLAFLLVIGISVGLGSLLAFKWEGVVFGVVAIFFALIAGGVTNLVFNGEMVRVNCFCFLVGGLGVFSGLVISNGYLLLSIMSMLFWLVYFFKKFEEIKKNK